MLKDRTKFRIVLLLCVVIFMIGAVAGCYNPDDNEVNATNILKHFDLTDEKIIWDGNINDPYIVDDSVIVTLKKTETYPKLDVSVFGLDNAVGMEYLVGVTMPDNVANPEKWRQMVIIYLRPAGKEKLLETIRKIEQLEFVKRVNPNGIVQGV